ncbi:50S ribosomal protein L29 [Candidatus Woesearchaeota archaeon]|nr:50S ribosomal protein L29 [Candidatus Woesearchaeota archaeon]
MKRKEIKSAPKGELENKLIELKRELMKQNAQIRIGTTPTNPGKVKQMKKLIAKIHTQLKKTEAKPASSKNVEV